MLLALGACGLSPPSQAPDAAAADGGPTSEAGLPDAGPPDAGLPDAGPFDAGLLDAGAADGGPPDAGDLTAQPGGLVRLSLRDGGAVEGEWVAHYDHRLWAHGASDAGTFAVFRGPDAGLALVPDALVLGPPRALPGPVPLSFAQAQRQARRWVEALPLDGLWTVFQGPGGYHLIEDGYGDFAWDFVRTAPDGKTYTGSGLSNTDYLAWDWPVALPQAAVLEFLHTGEPDNQPGTFPDGALGNVVGVSLGGGYGLYFFHLQAGSVPSGLVVGQRLEAGTVLGRVGNSGWSLAPHLHLVGYVHDTSGFGPPRSWSIPLEFARLRTGRTAASLELRAPASPVTGDAVAN